MARTSTWNTSKIKCRISDFRILYDLEELDGDELTAKAVQIAQRASLNWQADPDIALLAIVDRLVAKQRYRIRDRLAASRDC